MAANSSHSPDNNKKTRKLGMLGTKLGMTQIFDAQGKRVGVTVVELGPCTVMAKKDPDKDGYTALQLGFGDLDEKHSNKAERGHGKKAGKVKRQLSEFRVSAEVAGQYEVGAELTVDALFKTGDVIDVTAKTKGRGYQGVVRRWGFKGSPASHGHHEFYRHGGSIGNREFPGRVFKNRKMAGQLGNERVTVQNMKVAGVEKDKNLLLVNGAVPGGPGVLVTVRPAVKAQRAGAQA